MANKKPKIRTEQIGVRLPPKLRFGLEIVARKNGLTLSEAMMRALEGYLEKDGIAAKHQGEMLTTLDKLWSESASERIVNLIGSGYETDEDFHRARIIKELDEDLKLAKRDWSYTNKEFYSICDENISGIDAAADDYGLLGYLVNIIIKKKFGVAE